MSDNLSCSYDELIRNCEVGFFPLYDEFTEKISNKEIKFIL